jgi:hypothetical protein
MYRKDGSCLALLVAILALPVIALPEEPGALPATVKPPQLLVDASPARFLPRWLVIGGQVRGRFEAVSGTSLLNSSNDAYYLSRIRLDLAFRPTPWLGLVVQAQDARAGAYNTAPASTAYYNPIDLRQGYVELNREGAATVTLRAGRQELAFGGERLIGPADWGISRTYDALNLAISRGRARVDFVAGSPVLMDSGRCDRHRPGEHFYAAYAAFRNLLPNTIVEPYVLFKQNRLIKSDAGAAGDALVASPGLRLTGNLRGRVDYIGEVAVQRGSWSADSVAAGAFTGQLGWTVSNASWKPRVSAEYSYASGDSVWKDGRRGTFDQFYPSNQAYFGMVGQFGWKNMKTLRAGFDFVARKKLKLRVDYNDFRLATVRDSLYNSSGSSVVLNRQAPSAHVGWGIDAAAIYQWSKIWKFGAGMGHLYAGSYLKESKFPAGYTYPYVMFIGTF